MTKNALFLYSIVIIGVVGSISYFLKGQDSPLISTQNFSPESDSARSESESYEMPENNSIAKSQQTGGLTTDLISEQPHLTESTHQNATKWSDAFDSIESAEAYFVNEEGELLKSGLDSFFKTKDLAEILDALDKVGTNEKSASRKNNLRDYFYKEFADTAHSERFSCASKICVVTFIGDAGATDHYQNLSKFSENYIFTNSTVNEYGEGVYKMLLVETDDASTLTINPK